MNMVTQSVNEQDVTLSEHIVKTVKNYLNTMDSEEKELNLFQFVIEEVEGPLFRSVMELTRYNQSKAARVLGVSRGTLRTKLKHYFGDEFIGSR